MALGVKDTLVVGERVWVTLLLKDPEEHWDWDTVALMLYVAVGELVKEVVNEELTLLQGVEVPDTLGLLDKLVDAETVLEEVPHLLGPSVHSVLLPVGDVDCVTSWSVGRISRTIERRQRRCAIIHYGKRVNCLRQRGGPVCKVNNTKV